MDVMITACHMDQVQGPKVIPYNRVDAGCNVQTDAMIKKLLQLVIVASFVHCIETTKIELLWI